MSIKPITLSGQKTLSLHHPTLVGEDSFSDTMNMVRATDGLWENRKGIKTFDNAVGSGEPVHSIHFWKPSAGSTRYLTVGSGTALYAYAESSSYSDGTFTSKQGSFTDAVKFEFAQYADVLIATNGTESMYSTTDNDTWTQRNGANTRVAKYILFANDTGYCADISGDRSNLFYGSTVPANPYEFANQVDIESDNGQVLTGLTNLGPVIVAAKDESIYSVDISTPARDQLDYGGGCVSHRSIVKAENDVYLATEEGIVTLSQRTGTTSSLAATPKSDPIQPLWELLVSKGNIAGIYYKPTRSIYWGVQTTEQDFVIVYNVQWDSWTYFVGMSVADWTIYEDSSGDTHLIFGDKNIDKIREINHPDRDDDAAPINSILETGSLNFGTDKFKQCNYLEISGYGSELMELEYEIYVDEQDIAEKSGTITKDNWASTVSTSASGSLASGSLASTGLSGYIETGTDLDVKYWVKRVPMERPFRTIKVKLVNSQIGVRWRYKAVTLDVEATAKDLNPQYIYN